LFIAVTATQQGSSGLSSPRPCCCGIWPTPATRCSELALPVVEVFEDGQ